MNDPKKFWNEISQRPDWREYILPKRTIKQFIEEGRKEATKISEHIENGSLVIDYGCGIGRITIPMMKYAKRVVGLDISEKFINLAQKGAGEYHLVDDFKEWEAATFVYSISVIQHNPPEERKKIVNHIYRLLKKGGQFFANFPKAGKVYRESSFVHVFTEQELVDLIGDAGFKRMSLFTGNLAAYGGKPPEGENEFFILAQK